MITNSETQIFGHLEIAFDGRVLRPRSWTTEQARWAAELLHQVPEGPVLELCCGAGHIGLLAVVDTQRALVSIDMDPVAVAFAASNAVAAGMGTQVEVREGRVDAVLLSHERFALIIADPPWVPRSEVASFPDDPRLAIDGGGDGMDIARICVTVAEQHLGPGGVVLMQLGSMSQVDRLREFASGGPLRVGEVRDFPGSGVVVRLDPVVRA